METQKQGIGRWGEAVARSTWSQGLGNPRPGWRIGRLEVDLIARDGPFLVIVEVKTRTEPVQADWHRMVSQSAGPA